jgi:hypothetical protein
MGRSTWHATLYALALTVTLLSRDVLGYTVMGVPAGVNTATGERPMRRDLKEFQASGAAFDLYVQALDQFQKDDQSDFLSYYEVSGTARLSLKKHHKVGSPFDSRRTKVSMDIPTAHGMEPTGHT